MKVYEERTQPAKTYQVCVRRTCDLCGRESSDTMFKGAIWGERGFDFDRTEITMTIKQKEGSEFPEGGSGTEIEIDLCPTCFKERLVPWLQGEGATVNPEDWSTY